MSRIVAIVGRPNVGKSTLFNRLVGMRKAIVDDVSGVTRDRHYGKVEWQMQEFTLIDTGGYVPNSEDVFETAIREQVKIAIEEADVLMFMVDVQTGVTDLDTEFAKILRRSKKPVFIISNKVDNFDLQYQSADFYKLGFDKIYNISAANGSGTGDLLDDICAILPEPKADDDKDETLPKFAVVGRPNVGKSSLVNALLGQQRNIVTDVAGTTRDTIDSHYNYFGKEFVLIDTAGIRRKKKVSEDIEFYAVMRSIKALENCDVALLVIDATIGIDAQDMNLVSLAIKNNRGLVVLVNKWDLVEKVTKTAKQFEDYIKNKLKPFDDVPVIFISATEKQRIFKAVDIALEVYENKTRKIPTHELNVFLQRITEAYPPPAIKGKYVKIKYGTQLPGNSPKFAFFCNLPQYVTDSYKRYLENKIRDNYNFKGVPINIFLRKK